MEPRKTRTSQKRLSYWLAPVALALGLILLILGNVAHFPWNPNNPRIDELTKSVFQHADSFYGVMGALVG